MNPLVVFHINNEAEISFVLHRYQEALIKAHTFWADFVGQSKISRTYQHMLESKGFCMSIERDLQIFGYGPFKDICLEIWISIEPHFIQWNLSASWNSSINKFLNLKYSFDGTNKNFRISQNFAENGSIYKNQVSWTDDTEKMKRPQASKILILVNWNWLRQRNYMRPYTKLKCCSQSFPMEL